MSDDGKFATEKTARILQRIAAVWMVAVLGGFIAWLLRDTAGVALAPGTYVLLLLAAAPAVGMWAWSRRVLRTKAS